ncbi:hypothetical protein O6H91_Y448400 [Diphasiastrum complanatum]|nr:hypothetical protein O6H91_Y448400 [Diphasiastrum complanatum]
MGSSSSIHGTHCFSSSSLMCATTQQYYSTHNITFPHTSPPPSSCTKTSTSIIAHHHGHHHESEQPLQLCKSIQSLACSWHLSTAAWYPHYHSASVVSKGSFYCLASNASSSIHHGNAEDKPFNALEAGGMVRESLGGVRHVLCLSNGHGEDAIAAIVLKEVMELASDTKLKVEALPLVGVGSAYVHASIPTIGPSKNMPSGGFIYMDSQQLFNDLRAGLLGLTLDQWRTVAHWMDEHPDGFILAVGDIFPLALAWLASRKLRKKLNLARYFGYAFIGTAKSEYYIRGDDGKPLKSEWEGHLRGLLFPKSVYFPWERFIMADTYCRLIVPRDGLTCKILRRCLPAAAKDKV